MTERSVGTPYTHARTSINCYSDLLQPLSILDFKYTPCNPSYLSTSLFLIYILNSSSLLVGILILYYHLHQHLPLIYFILSFYVSKPTSLTHLPFVFL